MSSKNLKLYRYLCYGIFVLIALGGSVRVMNAGLACPDWPLCFGDIIPDYHPEVYFEFIHRALAGIIGIVSVYLNILVCREKSLGRTLRVLAGFTIVLLLTQVVMGGLTVLLKLHDKVVALHLGLGTLFFALSLWIYLSLRQNMQSVPVHVDRSKFKWVSLIAVVAVFAQIILGGLVASNYAASVCPEFPLCHGQFIPTLSGTIGLHIIHRLGAYALTIILLTVFFYIRTKTQDKIMLRYAHWMMGTLLLQVGLGIANVLLLTPPLLAVLHLATGVYLLSIVVRMLRLATFRRQNIKT